MGYKKNYEQYEGLEGWEKKTIGEQLMIWAEKYANRIAVVDEERRVTYTQLFKRAEEIASALWERGIRAGERIIIQLPNSVTFAEAFFGCILLGAIPIMALPAHRIMDLEGIIKHTEPVAYIIPDTYMGYEYLPMAKAIKQICPSLKHIIVDGEAPEGMEVFREFIGKPRLFEQPSSYETALLLLSGGTTGTPKLIPRTHSDYIYNAVVTARGCQLDEKGVYLAILPAAHHFSLACPGLLGTLRLGGKVVMSPSSSPDEALPLIEAEKVTTTALVPALIQVFSEVMTWEVAYDLSSWKVIQVGGALLDPLIAEKIMNEWPCQLIQVYGASEGTISFTHLEDSRKAITQYQGYPISEADEMRIIDEVGNEVPEGTYGQIIVRGPYTIDHYYKAPELDKEWITQEGFYCTGDLACWHTGYGLKIGGRIKEQINRSGEKIMPAEIETYLQRHPNIYEAAVVGVPDELLGQKSCAFVKMQSSNTITEQDVAVFFKKIGVAHYKIPDKIFMIEQWPVTSVGKIDKKQLRNIALEEEKKKYAKS